MFEDTRENAVQGVDHFLHEALVGLRLQVEEALQGEAPVGAGLNGVPDLVVGDVELCEEGAVGNVVEALRVEACALDEVLHHLDALYL